MKKKYLITGAGGFIGSALAREFIDENHQVWTIDNLSTGFIDNIPSKVEFIEGNCQDDSSLNKLKKVKFDAIFHFAGQSSGEISFDDPIYDLRTNTESTIKLIDYSLKTGCKRFIYASSMSVYGDVPDYPIKESHERKPLSFYGVGKLASEHYLRIYQNKGLKPTSLRIFNVYGPGQNLSNLRQGMVSIFLAQMINNNKIVVKGSPDRFRDFINIKDVVNIVKLILSNNKSINKTYNIGTGIKTTVKKLISTLTAIYAKKVDIIFSGSTPGDQLGIVADTKLLNSDINYNGLIELDKGLKEMVEWARNDLEK